MFRRSLFTHDFLLLMAGPIVWGLHFLLIYGFTGVVCARQPTNATLVTWGVLAADALALAVLVAVFLLVRARAPAPEDRQLVRQVGIGLAALSALAIVWETIPLLMVTPCS